MDKNNFMFAILNDPSLSQKDRERIISLITRDIEQDLMSQTQRLIRDELKQKEASKDDGVKEDRTEKMGWIHNPVQVCNFLRKFSSDPILKFALHSWDKGDFSGGYEDFIKQITQCLDGDNIYKNLYYYNIGLYYTLKNFLQEAGGKRDFSIPKENILIGLRHPEGTIQEWMKNNPNKKLAEMPMTEFPEEYRPKGLYNGRAIANMEELIEYFKHIIEFRDFDFEAMVYDTFSCSDFTPDINESVNGISFYAYTSVVKSFLITVLGNIKGRIQQGAPKTVKIFVTNPGESSFELHILHEGSFACKVINDKKLLYTGNVASWRLWKPGNYNSLLSVCDYSVESKFYTTEETKTLKSYRIDYLFSGLSGSESDDLPEPRVTKMKQEAKGFEYILKFYK